MKCVMCLLIIVVSLFAFAQVPAVPVIPACHFSRLTEAKYDSYQCGLGRSGIGNSLRSLPFLPETGLMTHEADRRNQGIRGRPQSSQWSH